MSSSNNLKAVKQLLRFLPDRVYIQLYYFAKFHRFCNLRKPRTYNEKLQWLKLNYRLSEHSKLVDKYEAKQIVADLIGAKFVIPTLGLYNTACDINFDELPDSFVLKCTHDSEGVILVRDKRLMVDSEVRKTLRRALSQNFYNIGREYPYKNLQPRIIAEPLLVDDTYGQLYDYKFFCFDGEVRAIYVASDRSTGSTKFDYFDVNFRPLNVRQSYPTSVIKPARPRHLQEMLSIAGILSKEFPHVRVDLYQVNGQVFFGEMTFYHLSGFAPFKPPEYDILFGDWLRLPAPVNLG